MMSLHCNNYKPKGRRQMFLLLIASCCIVEPTRQLGAHGFLSPTSITTSFLSSSRRFNVRPMGITNAMRGMIKSDWIDDESGVVAESQAKIRNLGSSDTGNEVDRILSPNNNETRNLNKGFNPFNYDASSSAYASSSTRMAGRSTRISLRASRMQDLNRELLDAVGATGKEARNREIRAILQSYKEFLLEPLDDADAVMDADSIYSPEMSREERYDAFHHSMDKRISSSRNINVRAVLEAMRDFVLEFK